MIYEHYRTSGTKTQRDLSPSPSTHSLTVGARLPQERGTVYLGAEKTT
jgi:hypothetical protein